MVLTTLHVAWFIATLPVIITLARLFWRAAEFFISAKINLATLTVTVEKIEHRLDMSLVSLEQRVTKLERKEDIRHAIEEEHNGV